MTMARPGRLHLISADAADTVDARLARDPALHRVSSLAEVRAALEREADGGTAAATLDLMGHSTRDHHFLRLGATPVDLMDPAVARWFESLAADGVLSRLGVGTLRLLGCETAVEVAGQRTMLRLARLLGIRVCGTRRPLLRSHYDADGIAPAFVRSVLIEASELPQPLRRLTPDR
ncbi:MAG: hypothetical protein ABMB14_33505 [Myxococcota bacterium]